MLLAVGLLIGFALGLTGAGGSIVAVPLLLFTLDLRPQDAMGISLGAVSAASIIGVLLRSRQGQPPVWGAALWLAMTGMAAAPVGRWFANQVNEQLIVVLFSLLAFSLAIRMWRSAARECGLENTPADAPETWPGGGLNQRLVLLLAGAGLGLLTGFFGVGGGFLIVPFLSLYVGLRMSKAISTSLLVIALVGSSGYLYHVLNAPGEDFRVLGVLSVASILGILGGTALSSRLSGPRLQQVFSVFVMAIVTYMLMRTLA